MEKKIYQKPKMRIIEVKVQQQLLNTSSGAEFATMSRKTATW